MYFTQAALIAAISATSTGVQAGVLELSTFQKVWTSELDHQSYEDAETSFATENAFMTAELATFGTLDASSTDDAPVSSILCNHQMGQSGYERAQQIYQQYPNSNLSVLYNKKELSCFLAALPSSTFAENNNKVLDSWTVAPLTSYMKIRAGTVETIESAHESGEDLKSIGFSVCLPATQEQDSASIADGILERIQARDEETGRSLAMDKFHWTRSDVVHDRMLYTSTHHSRIGRWRQAMEEGINAEHQCQSLFDDLETLPTSDVNDFIFTMGHGDAMDPSSAASAHCMLSLVASLAAQPEVCSVENVQQNKEVNDIAQWITQSYEENKRPFWDVGLAGAGQVVQVSDSGLDTNNCYFWDADGEVVKDLTRTVDNSRRKVIQYYAYKDGVALSNDHGTHVAGSVLGHRALDGKTESTGQADGTGRDAKLAFFDIGLGAQCCYVPGSSTLFGPGADAGAKLHSASWGSNSATYTSSARDFDNYIYNNDDFLPMVAAGNSGNGNAMQTVGSPATAKNIIAVGASASGGRDLFSGAEKYLAYFSSRGPTADGRLKPDIVAPGYQILSSAGVQNQVGECDAGIPSWGGQAGGLSYKSGTSMATPVVSGNMAIVRQYLSEGWYPSGAKVPADAISRPSAALMKAIVLNGGQSLQAVYQTNGSKTPVAEYDNNQGFGRINMLNSLPLVGKNDISMKLYHDETITQGQLESVSVDVVSCESTNEVRATLVWTDPPGQTGCSDCLINDLDLVASKSGTVFYPNGGTSADTKNNAERIRLPAAAGDKITVSVKGTNLANSSQKYSLVITGCLDNVAKTPTTAFPTKAPTKAPSHAPTISAKPTADTGELQPALQTTLAGGNGSGGAMFDLKAKDSDIYIHSFDVVEQTRKEVEVWIYTKAGTHSNFQTNKEEWTRIGSTTIISKGNGVRVPIGERVFKPVYVKAGDTQAFYITFPTGTIAYTNGNSFGAVYAQDDNLQFLQGSGLPHEFGGKYSPRVWNGAITYSKVSNEVVAPAPATPAPVTPAPVTAAPVIPAPVTPAPVVTRPPEWLSEMLTRVNKERADTGAPALCYNDKLIAAALTHSQDMADNDFLSHTGSDGSSAGDRATRAGYAWNGIAENIASGQKSVEQVMDAWMDSAPHKANILNSAYEHFGVARVNDRWTQVFGLNNSGSEICSSTVTPAPVTAAPTLPPVGAVTPAPVTSAPIPSPSAGPTEATVTPAPVTSAPIPSPSAGPTEATVTPAPVTSAPIPSPSAGPTEATVTPAPVTSAPIPSPSAGPTSGSTKSVYDQALEELSGFDTLRSREEKNEVVARILELMKKYDTSLAEVSSIIFADESL